LTTLYRFDRILYMSERQALIQAREQLGLSQEQAAQLIGKHIRTIRYWEQGDGGTHGGVIGAMLDYTRALLAYRDEHGFTHVSDEQLKFETLFPDVVARARVVA
jgi:transcriptional regulator with XRE-family HTH domain